MDDSSYVLTLLLILAAYYFATRRERLLRAAITGLVLISWPPVAYLIELPLTFRYSAEPPMGRGAEAIVLLAGRVILREDTRRLPELQLDTRRRVLKTVSLFFDWNQLPVYVAGGSTGSSRMSRAAAIERDLLRRGVPANGVQLEQASTNTFEQAVNTAKILRRDRIKSVVLVTSGHHLLRATLCFQKQGIAVYPVSADAKRIVGWRDVIPSERALEITERTVREYLALVWYWCRGRL